MKLKRTKLAALAMSALMAVSAFSPYVYAEEEASTEVATEEVTEAAEDVVSDEAAIAMVAEEAIDEAGETSETGNVADKTATEYSFDYTVTYYNAKGEEAAAGTDVVTSFKAVITAYNEYGTAKSSATLTPSAKTFTDSDAGITYTATWAQPSCAAVGSLKVTVKYYSHEAGKEVEVTLYTTDSSVTGYSSEGKTALAVKPEHTSVEDRTQAGTQYVECEFDANGDAIESTIVVVTSGMDCSDHSGVQYRTYCSVCGKELGYSKVYADDTAPHDFDESSKTAVVIEADSEPDSNIVTSTKLSSSVNCNIVTAEGESTATTISNAKVYSVTIDSTTGEPQLVNTAKSGTYYWRYKCLTCGEYVYVKATVKATQSTYVKIIGDPDGNVAAFWIGETDGTYGKTDTDARLTFSDIKNWKFATDKDEANTEYATLPTWDQVELEDCTQPGYYYIEYYAEDGTLIDRERIDVKAHHMEVEVAVFSTAADMNLCELSYDSDGNLVVESTSCYYDIEYTKVVECYAECCKTTSCSHSNEKHVEKNKVTKTQVWNGLEGNTTYDECTYSQIGDGVKATAVASGAHTYLKDVYEALKSYISTEKSNGTVVTTYTVSDALTALLESKATAEGLDKDYYKAYAEITNDTSSCTSIGDVTVTFYCTTHPAGNTYSVRTYTVSVYPTGHIDPGYNTVENYVEATCESAGSYDSVRKCTRCGLELQDTVTVTIPRLRHTNEVAGTYNELTGEYKDDTTNKNDAATIYLQFVGDRIVDTGSALLNAYNAGKTTISNGDITQLIGGTSENDSTLGVLVRVYTNCTTCNNHEVELDSDTKGEGVLTITIDDIKAQDTNGAGGYITLTATFTSKTATVSPATITGTFNYYTSATAYNGRVDKDTAYDPDVTTKNGLQLDDDGVYRYYVGGEFASDFAGLVEYDGAYFFVANGLVCTDANGLNLYNGTWYMLAYGQVQSQYTGVTIYDGEVFYITNGILDTSVTGLKEYDGAQFLFCYGRLMSEVSGLWYYDSAIGGDDTFYYLAYGQVVNYSGAVIYDNTFFLVENGKLSTYTGVYTYDGVDFNVINGEFVSQVA